MIEKSEHVPEIAISVVQRQLDAYNAHDMDAFLACYASDVIVVKLPENKVICRGLGEMETRYRSRFAEGSTVHAVLMHRIHLGSRIIDHENVTGLSDSPLNVAAIYEVREDLIRWVAFLNSM